MIKRRGFLMLAPAALVAPALISANDTHQDGMLPAGSQVIPFHGVGCPYCLPVMQAPPHVDLFDDSDPTSAQVLADAHETMKGIRNNDVYGVILPAGWTLSLLGAEAHIPGHAH